MKSGDSKRRLVISRAFDQIQVFVQMLGGYFIKKGFDKFDGDGSEGDISKYSDR